MKRRVASLLGALVLLTSAVMMAGCPQSAKPDIRKYKITLNQGEHGTVTVDPVLPKDGMVAQYAKLTFTATPD
ncbi:leucine-rich repeat domain-containing protein, partial [Treponema sp. OMZ 805]